MRFYFRVLLTALCLVGLLGTQNAPAFDWSIARYEIDEGQSSAVGAVDLDNDGDVDIFSVFAYESKIIWYENIGESTPVFTAHVITTAPYKANEILAADMDRDGDQDLLAASTGDNRIRLYINNGNTSPRFEVHYYMDGSVPGPHSLQVADFDRDGDRDFLSVSKDHKIFWHENQGGRPLVFSSHLVSASGYTSNQARVADIDEDGDLDIISDAGVIWYENQGGNPIVFLQHSVSVSVEAYLYLDVADLDGDGDMDVAYCSPLNNRIAWLENVGGSPPAFSEHAIATEAGVNILARDLDSDGDMDLLVAQEGSGLRWFENDGGTFSNLIPYRLTSEYTCSAFVADLDGDCLLDVFTAGDGVARLEVDFDELMSIYSVSGVSSYTNQTSIAIEGILAATQMVSKVMVNDVTQTIDAEGRFYDVVPLEEGENEIVAKALRIDGCFLDRDALRIIRDTIPPTLSVVYPVPGQGFVGPEITVRGVVTDSLPVTVWVSGQTVAPNANGGFEIVLTDLPLAGEIVVRVYAEDAAGNRSEQIAIPSTDIISQTLSVVSPIPGQKVHGTKIPVHGNVIDSCPLEVWVNGQSVVPEANGDFEVVLTDLPLGETVIRVYTEDSSGNRSEEIVIPVFHFIMEFPVLSPLHADAEEDMREDIRPRIASDGQGCWGAVWQSSEGILAARSVDDASSWSSPVPIAAQGEKPELAIGAPDDWVVVWMSGGALYFSRSTDCGASWITPATFGNGSAPSIASDGAGTYVAAFQLGGSVLCLRSGDFGQSWSEAKMLAQYSYQLIGDDPRTYISTEHSYRETHAAYDSDGKWLIVCDHKKLVSDWDGGYYETSIRVSWSVDEGQNWYGPHPLFYRGWDEEWIEDRYPRLATAGSDDWLVVWKVDKRFGAEQVLGRWEFDLGGWTDAPLDFGGVGNGPHAAYLGSGTWIVAGDQGGKTCYAYSSDIGQSWTEPQSMGSGTGYVHVASDGKGRVVLAWDSNGGDSESDRDIYYAVTSAIMEPASATPTPTFTPTLAATLTPTFTPTLTATPNETAFTPTPTFLPADLNKDRWVDPADLVDLLVGMEAPDTGVDLTGDGVDDYRDLFEFSRWWDQGRP